MTVRTSQTDPIRVDFVPEDAGLGPGRLGMTLAPGKKAPSRIFAGEWDRDLDADLERLVSEYGARVLVSLLWEHEYDELGIKDLPARAESHGLEWVECQIRDGGIPPTPDVAAKAVRRILEHLRSPGTVVVHCRGGLGRTGMIVACCLTAVDYDPERAIRIVRGARKKTIETVEQEQFVHEFAVAWLARRPQQES